MLLVTPTDDVIQRIFWDDFLLFFENFGMGVQVYDSEEDMMKGLNNKEITKGATI